MTPALTWTVWSVTALSTPLATVDVAFVAPVFFLLLQALCLVVWNWKWMECMKRVLIFFKVAFLKVKWFFTLLALLSLKPNVCVCV